MSTPAPDALPVFESFAEEQESCLRRHWSKEGNRSDAAKTFRLAREALATSLVRTSP